MVAQFEISVHYGDPHGPPFAVDYNYGVIWRHTCDYAPRLPCPGTTVAEQADVYPVCKHFMRIRARSANHTPRLASDKTEIVGARRDPQRDRAPDRQPLRPARVDLDPALVQKTSDALWQLLRWRS